MSTKGKEKVGVVLMTYGSATTAEGVNEYFGRIYGGKASADVVTDFERRYRLVGRSPLVEITNQQASLLEARLGSTYVVCAGMLHSDPFIADAVASCVRAGATSLIGVILSPQYSALIMKKYHTVFGDAARASNIKHVSVAPPWPTEARFIEFLAEETKNVLTEIKKETGEEAPVVFTTHSLPKRVVEQDPSYLQQLQQTIDAVRAKLNPSLAWHAAYQSAGHRPEEWLKPDLVDVLAELAGAQTRAVAIVPIQFLADHLEVLYDLDIAAHAQCKKFGIIYHRTSMPSTNPLFVEALADIVSRAGV